MTCVSTVSVKDSVIAPKHAMNEFLGQPFEVLAPRSLHGWRLLATVGLGVSDFGYRIFALLVSVVSCMIWSMNSVHGFSAQAWL